MQEYARRSKHVKPPEEEKWSQIDYRYMTEESDSEDYVRQHKLEWRSQGIHPTKPLYRTCSSCWCYLHALGHLDYLKMMILESDNTESVYTD